MHYIVGLGNPGNEYALTRHNVGFLLLSWFLEDIQFSQPHESSAYSAQVSEGVFEGTELRALFPNTYMNDSGSAVKKTISSLEDTNRLLVIYDDIDLPLGMIKVSIDRGDGGHNGIKSISAALGTTKYARLRVGIAKKSLLSGIAKRPKGEALVKYVLGTFSKKDMAVLESMRSTVRDAVHTFVSEGIERTMNKFN